MHAVKTEGGVDFLHVDTGCYEVWNKQIPTVYEGWGCQLHAVEAVRAAVSLPLLIHGKLNHPSLAEEVFEKGLADVILMGHQSLADPEYRGDIIGFNMRGLALPITGKYLGAIVTPKAE